MGRILKVSYTVLRPDLSNRAAVAVPTHEAGRPGFKLPAADGAKLWAELHSRALTVNPSAGDEVWLAAFRLRLPCGDCRKHWDGMLTGTPPVWSDYFAWTVARHNEVNQRLGKPVLDEAAARSIWAAAAPVL